MAALSYLHSITVDIRKKPTWVNSSPAPRTVIFGDAHGNTLKILHSLVTTGAISLTTTQYQEFRTLYRKKAWDAGDLEQYQAWLKRLKFNRHIKTIFIGDELADRGWNDYFTMGLLRALHDNGVPFQIALSNHSMEFVKAYENYDRSKPYHPVSNNFGSKKLYDELGRSLNNLDAMVQQGLVTPEYILDFADNVYKPHLRLVPHCERDGKTIIATHAGIGDQEIADLADFFHLKNIKDDSALLSAINQKFSRYIIHNQIHTLFSDEEENEAAAGDRNQSPENIILRVIWNRCYHLVREVKNRLYVHGHDKHETSSESVINLDENNLLGKTYEGFASHPDEENNQGKLNFYVAAGPAMAELLNPEDRKALQVPHSSCLSRALQDPYTPAFGVATLAGGIAHFAQDKFGLVLAIVTVVTLGIVKYLSCNRHGFFNRKPSDDNNAQPEPVCRKESS